MKFGISHCNVGTFAEPEHAEELARQAEVAGFESLWTVEHVVIPDVYEPRYPETSDGRFWFAHNLPLADPLIWMTFVAALTSHLHLGTGILAAPQRNPLITAKEVATLDRLSGGRVELGVGVGWLREEFEALGVEFAGRGDRTEEAIEVMRELWQPGPRFHEGRLFSFTSVHCEPSPPRPAVPIHVGGATSVAARRAGRIGDGFFPGGYDHKVLVPLVEEARREFKESGRDGRLEITVRWTKDPAGLSNRRVLDLLQSLDIDRVLVPAATVAAGGLEKTLTDLGSTVLPAYA